MNLLDLIFDTHLDVDISFLKDVALVEGLVAWQILVCQEIRVWPIGNPTTLFAQ